MKNHDPKVCEELAAKVCGYFTNRHGKLDDFNSIEGHDHSHLSDRDREVAQSIAHVAAVRGWARMVSDHTHAKSPAITLAKPKEE